MTRYSMRSSGVSLCRLSRLSREQDAETVCSKEKPLGRERGRKELGLGSWALTTNVGWSTLRVPDAARQRVCKCRKMTSEEAAVFEGGRRR